MPVSYRSAGKSVSVIMNQTAVQVDAPVCGLVTSTILGDEDP
jgi:hypothetical protein